MEHHAGMSLSADKQTKLENIKDHRIFACSIQGLPLSEFDYFAQFNDEEEQFRSSQLFKERILNNSSNLEGVNNKASGKDPILT